jgi:hypothetical protein
MNKLSSGEAPGDCITSWWITYSDSAQERERQNSKAGSQRTIQGLDSLLQQFTVERAQGFMGNTHFF